MENSILQQPIHNSQKDARFLFVQKNPYFKHKYEYILKIFELETSGKGEFSG